MEYEPHIVGGLSLHLSRSHHDHSDHAIDTRSLSYCAQHPHAADRAKVRLLSLLKFAAACLLFVHKQKQKLMLGDDGEQSCQIWDDDAILVQRGVHTAMITTRVQYYLQVLNACCCVIKEGRAITTRLIRNVSVAWMESLAAPSGKAFPMRTTISQTQKTLR